MRAQIFVDDKLGREDFGAAVDAWIDRHAVGDSTKDGYRVTARAWVKPTFEGRTIAQVATDRDRVADLLAKDMGHLSITRRRQARTIITGTMNEAVRAGKLTKHNLSDIDIKDTGRAADRADFVFPAHGQITQVADRVRDCGVADARLRPADRGRRSACTVRISAVRVFCGLRARRRGTGARSFR